MNSASSHLMVSLYSEMFSSSLNPRSSCMSRLYKPSFCPRFLAKMLRGSSGVGTKGDGTLYLLLDHTGKDYTVCPSFDLY